MPQSKFQLSKSALVSQRVIHAVAETTNTGPLELEPLYNSIDPKSLNELFEPTNTGSQRETGSAAFEYAGCDVTVFADGTVNVTSCDAQTESQASPTSVD